ncbi:cell division protein ZapE [Mangrovibacter yixingensis]|uniref:cell division protein ZapE n=1 Tax=Mangrovibacter yixingensis TaxID=1529639 RepID=UPI001CFE3260|nr:cell division protein ZapE [Mangrovibacter yixingensis]
MQTLSPASRYEIALRDGQFQPDHVQLAAITQLDAIYQALVARQTTPNNAVPKGLTGKITKWFNRQPDSPPPVKGLYMWGGVGRGKTWLMDMFFQSIPGERKLRLHFHRFMLRVHEELTRLQGHSDPLEIVADSFKAQTDLLCFDEFFVSDITDAMLLGGLMQALFSRGITLVATSNIPPENLYHNGLQRSRFLPAIAAIQAHCDVMNVDAGVDYRLRALTQAHLWLSPCNADNQRRMEQLFQALSGSPWHEGQGEVLEVNHRSLATLGSANQTLAVTFDTLCVDARSQHDYIALSHLFHTVMLYNVPVMDSRIENAARRFIALVDEFYERQVKLVVLAQVPLFEIYQGEHLKFEFQRCLSRLQEMQSEAYLQAPHRP